MGTGFSKQKKQMKQMQDQIMQMQQSIEQTIVEGFSSNDLVKIKLDGKFNMINISINQTCVDPEDVEGLEILIKQAYNDAVQKISQQSMPSNMNLGGFGLF